MATFNRASRVVCIPPMETSISLNPQVKAVEICPPIRWMDD